MKFRKTKVICPVCHENKLEAVQLGKMILSYRCSCGTQLEAEAFFDAERDEYWWIGKHRNPEYFGHGHTLEEGLSAVFELEEKGVPTYIGRYPIEKIR